MNKLSKDALENIEIYAWQIGVRTNKWNKNKSSKMYSEQKKLRLSFVAQLLRNKLIKECGIQYVFAISYLYIRYV